LSRLNPSKYFPQKKEFRPPPAATQDEQRISVSAELSRKMFLLLLTYTPRRFSIIIKQKGEKKCQANALMCGRG